MNFTKSHDSIKTTLLFLSGLLVWAVFLCLLPFPASAQNQTSPAESQPENTSVETRGSEILAPVVRGDSENPAPVVPITNATEELPPVDNYFKSQPESSAAFSWSNYFLVIGAMFLLLGLLWFVVWTLKKRNALPGGTVISRNAFKIEASLPMGTRRALVVVRFLNSRYLLGVTDQQINLIKELEELENALPEATPANPASVKTFAAMLKKASQKSDNQNEPN